MIDKKELKSLDDFLKLINKYKITSLNQFISTFGVEIYNRFISLRRYGSIPKNTPFPLSKEKRKYVRRNIKTKEDLENFIVENKISSLSELSLLFPGIYSNFKKLSIFEKKEISIFNKHRFNNELINTIEDLQNYIYDENIQNRSQLRNTYPGLFNKFCKFTEFNNLKYCKNNFGSFHEYKFAIELSIRGINYISQYRIKDSSFTYDFFLEDFNIIIEIHGRHHFIENISEDAWNKSYNNIINRDKEKYDLCKKSNIKIYYFTYEIGIDISNYFANVFTDLDILFNQIDRNISILYSKKEVLDLDKKLSTIDENLILSQINTYILENGIIDRLTLRNYNSHYYWLMTKYELSNKLMFMKDYTLDKFNYFINRNNIINEITLLSKYPKIYKVIKKKGWLKDIQYYREK